MSGTCRINVRSLDESVMSHGGAIKNVRGGYKVRLELGTPGLTWSEERMFPASSRQDLIEAALAWRDEALAELGLCAAKSGPTGMSAWDVGIEIVAETRRKTE